MQTLLPTPPDFSFHETLNAHGWRCLPPFLWHDDTQTLERVEHLPGGVALLHIQADGDAVAVEWDGAGDADEVGQRVRRMLQMDVPIGEFHAYCAARPELANVAACRQGRMLRSPTLWEDAVKVITTTNTTWAQTIAMCARLSKAFGSPLPQEPSRCSFPSPAQVAAVPFGEFAAEARMGYRNAYVHALATMVAGGTLDLEALQDEALAADVLRKRLLSLPGIGPYAAACLMLYLGRPEHVNADSWARTLVGKELGRPVTDKDVYAFFAEHGAWRGLVYTFYPWKEGERGKSIPAPPLLGVGGPS